MKKMQINTYRLGVIGLLFVSLSLLAQNSSLQSVAMPPSTNMSSVNNSGYMTTGSAYSSSISDVGAYSPSAAPSGPRRAGGPGGSTGGESGYDPANPQFSPIGDAVIPLLLMTFIYALVVLYKRKRKFS